MLRKSWWICIFTMFAGLYGCGAGATDESRMVGLWGMGNITGNGQIVSDGKEWFDFKANGTVESRTSPFTYQSGTWLVDEKNHFLWLREGTADSLRYEYRFVQDTLLLSAVVLNVHQIGMCLVPISKKPIEASQEMKLP